MKVIRFHSKAREAIRSFDPSLRKELGELLLKLQIGIVLGMPQARPMTSIGIGAHELRMRDKSGIHRVFYYLKSEHGILIFHAFTKKTQKTPQNEIDLARKRLKEMLTNEKAT